MKSARPALIVILLVAFAFRFYDLANAPPGFCYDEGLDASFAQRVLAGDWRMFYGDREGLYFYPLAAAVALFGPSLFAFRFLSVAVSFLSVAATYALGRRLLGTATGLLAAACLAILPWHFGLNRFAERMTFLPLLEAATILSLWNALYPKEKTGPWRPAMLAGVCLGLSLYSYLAARAFPIALAGFFLYQVAFDRATLRQSWHAWLACIATSLVVFSPLATHFALVPSDFSIRTSQTWPFAGLGTLDLIRDVGRQALIAFGMFGFSGDLNWRHNLAGRPGFDVLAAVALYGGIVLAVAQPRRRATAMLLIVLGVMLAPSFLAAENPHFRRAFGALPAAVVLGAYGAVTVASNLAVTRVLRQAAVGLAVLWFLWSGYSATQAYFVDWKTNPEALAAFEADVVDGAAVLNTLPQNFAIAASAWMQPHPGVEYLLHPSRELRWFSGRDGLVVLPGESAYALFGQAEAADALLGTLAPPAASGARLGPDGRPLFRLYRVSAEAAFRPTTPAGATFGQVARLEGIDFAAPTDGAGERVVSAGATIPLRLYWRILGAAGRDDLAFTVRLRGVDNQTIAQDDVSPYPSGFWRGGELVIATVDLEIPAVTRPGLRAIEVGLYQRDGARLPARDESGRNLGDSFAAARVKVVRPAAPADGGPALARFVNGIELRSASFAPYPCGAATCPERLVLVWRAGARVPTALTVFVHLALPDGRPVVQADGPPLDGLMPTTVWAPGETIVEDRRLVMPTTPLPGPLRLLVGLYDPSTGARVPTLDLNDAVVVGR